MKAYYVKYIYNDRTYEVQIDAVNLKSALNKIGRKYRLTADEVKDNITLVDWSVIGYF